jgi:hypothetical protein
MERLVLCRATRARYSTITGSTKDAAVFASFFFRHNAVSSLKSQHWIQFEIKEACLQLGFFL